MAPRALLTQHGVLPAPADMPLGTLSLLESYWDWFHVMATPARRAVFWVVEFARRLGFRKQMVKWLNSPAITASGGRRFRVVQLCVCVGEDRCGSCLVPVRRNLPA